MEFGFDVPNVHHGLGLEVYVGGADIKSLAIDPETFDRLSSRIEEIGFHTMWIADHVVFPDSSSLPHPLGYQANTIRSDDGTSERTNVRSEEPIYEALSVLAYLGARTQRCRVGIGVLVIPYRNPVVAGKALATIDLLTRGRVTVGAGVGWLKESFEATGADYEHRGAVTDEYIEVMRVLWSEDAPVYHGRHFTLPDGLRFRPKPVQQPIPLLIGGVSGPAIRRAARLGDGWMAPYQSIERFTENRIRIRQLLEANGRDPDTFTFQSQVRFQVVDADVESKVDADGDCIGRPARIAEMIRAHHAAGVDHLQLKPPPGPTSDALVEQASRFADQVLPLIEDLWEPAAPPAAAPQER
jgi:probable F420-dependent oxidoreductase